MKHYVVVNGIEPIGIVDEEFYRTEEFDEHIENYLKETYKTDCCMFKSFSPTVDGAFLLRYKTEMGVYEFELKEIKLNQLSVEMGVNW